MSRDRHRTCLVLASRHALERLSPAIDVALSSLDLERVFPPPPDRVVDQLGRVDVIFAEISKPSPAVSFELGVAAALGIPTVFFATEAAQTSPVFGLTFEYDPDESTSRLGYVFAKQLELALSRADKESADVVEPDRDVPSTSDVATADAVEYAIGERFEGPVVHVNREGGFVLIGSTDRRPAMLHATNMTDRTVAALENNMLDPGDIVLVEVMSIDLRRRQVQVRDLGLREPDMNCGPAGRTDLVAQVLREWALIEDHLRAGEAAHHDDLQRFTTLFEDELGFVRHVRNRLAHGETVPSGELEVALSYATKLLGILEAPRPR